MAAGPGQWSLRLTLHALAADDIAALAHVPIGETRVRSLMCSLLWRGPSRVGALPDERMMSPNKKKVLLPKTMAKAGWDVLIGRDDIEAVGYDPYISMGDLQVALQVVGVAALVEVDGVRSGRQRRHRAGADAELPRPLDRPL